MARLSPLLWLSLAFVAACGQNIGDSCQTNVDCSRAGDRFCDTASPGGYCTIEGCEENTCPDEAVCIRFFTPVLSRSCTFDPAAPNHRADCAADERCVCDRAIDGVCQDGAAHCAPESSERRWCALRCDKDSDCRDEYTCRSTGSLGAEPVPTLDVPNGAPARFCAPRGG